MERDYVFSILDGLKSTSSSRVQESLHKLRSKVRTNEGIKLFTNSGGLNYLVPHLRKPNERILDLTLSILGTCCLNDECRLAVGKLPIVAAVISVLTTVSRDSIVGRGCRVVGNLAQDIPNTANLHNHGAVPALISVIESRDKNTSYPTLTMAVRALRQLWMVPDKRDEMLSVYAVQCIAKLFITECESAGLLKTDNARNEPLELRRSQEELFGGILKCLAYCTTHVTAQCAEQVQGDGRGYECLVALTKINEYQAIRCLINLCYLTSCRPLLGAAGLVLRLVEILQMNSDMAWWPEGTVRMLCQLSGESVNRARIREHGGLPLLVAAARDHTFALRALLQYVFDDSSFQNLVNAGLVNLVTDELKKHLITMECEHDYQVCVVKKRRDISEGLRVVIERDNRIYGFSDTTEGFGNQNNDETNPEIKVFKWLKRARSMSPTITRKRSREKAIAAYCNDASTSVSALNPAPRPSSPVVVETPLHPERRGVNKAPRGTWEWSPESGFDVSDANPGSPYSTDQWSQGGSPSPGSPFSVIDESSDSEISGRYSPVCSEPDVDATDLIPVPIVTELDAARVAMDELAVDDGDMEHNDEPPFEEPKRSSYLDRDSSRIACVLVLLYRLATGACDTEKGPTNEMTKPNNKVELLTNPESMLAMLEYMQKCRKPMGRVARIMTNIFNNPLCLMNILKHRIVLRLHNMIITTRHPNSKCTQCKLLKDLSNHLTSQLKVTAESSYGIGEISYQFLRGPDSMKKTLSLTLPYIVKSKAVLRKYYVECNALNVLFAAVPEDNKEFEYYVTALSKFATSVKIKDPKELEKKYLEKVWIAYQPILDGISVDELVTFELDDFTTVRASRKFLCQHSEVFGAMLMGCFKESIEESVRLQNVTKSGLEYLLTLLHLSLNKSVSYNRKRFFPMAENLETILEVLLLADRFLFENLKVALSSAILQFTMAPDTVEKIYVWSLTEGMGFLCVESVAYLLVGNMSERERSQVFMNILNLKYKEQWLDDIKSVILRQLEQ